jgi:hypothetical protein
MTSSLVEINLYIASVRDREGREGRKEGGRREESGRKEGRVRKRERRQKRLIDSQIAYR